jgi:iron complex transport system ATP-binding protein
VRSGVTVISVLHELPMALLADEMVLMQDGKITHQGRCEDAQTHRAMEIVFDNRVRVSSLEGSWVVLPVTG